MIKALKKLNMYVIATGNREGLVGQQYVDEYYCMDYSDKESILRLAQELSIDGICACCNDFGVYTAAYVAEQMQLPGYDSYEVTELLHNKDKFKQFAKEHNIASPISHSFQNEKDAQEYIQSVEFPVIIKPTDASAGNGITKVNSVEEGIAAIGFAFSKSRVKRIVIEPFIEGSQHGFCTYLVNRKVVFFCSNNEYSILNPYRVEIDTYPADTDEQTARFLINQIEKIANLLKLKDGIFHLQYIMKDGKPQIIEVMRRVLGNMYSIPAGYINQVDWDYLEVCPKCGCEIDIPNNVVQEGFYAYKTILANCNGEIEDIDISSKYTPYLKDQFMLMKPGDIITNYKNEPIGFLFLKFQSNWEMKNFLVEQYDNSIVKMKNEELI
jgi:hypothetical protein